MSRWSWVAVCVCLMAGFGLALPLMWLAAATPPATVACLATGATVSGAVPSAATLGLDEDQFRNACTIVAVTVRSGLPRRAAVVAIAVSKIEAQLLNLASRRVPGSELHANDGVAAGDLDSVGLFQQRLLYYGDIDPMDPVQATSAFLRYLDKVPGWEGLPVGEAAVRVQMPAGNTFYVGKVQEQAGFAEGIVNAMWDASLTGTLTGGASFAGDYAMPLAREWYQRHPDWFSKPHHDYAAADIGVPSGTPVYAVVAGLVISSPAGGACGQGVVVDGDDGHRYTYCHGISPLVPRGAQVRAGDPIMISGNTGRSTGPHLHLQITLELGRGDVVCPQPALRAWAQGRAVDIAGLPRAGCTS